MIIRDQTDFTYAGISSLTYGITNVNINNGMQEEPFIANKEILETNIKGRTEPYFNEISYKPLQFSVSFSFDDTWDDVKIKNVVNWLCNYSFYQPLYFGANLDQIYYALVVDDSTIIHNCLSQGYLRLNFRCNDSYTYSRVITSSTYNVTTPQIITLQNDGDINCYPTIYVTKNGISDLSIINQSDNNREFKFTNLSDNEILIIYNEDKIITTNLLNTYRYDNFNDNYLYLIKGSNSLQITGSCTIYFKWQYKRL